jgi:hypothetical protein
MLDIGIDIRIVLLVLVVLVIAGLWAWRGFGATP